VVSLLAFSACGAALAQNAESSSAETQAPALRTEAMKESRMVPAVQVDESPVAQVRKRRSWEFGPFVNFGNGIGTERSGYWFFSAGAQAGKILTPPVHASILSGQFELGASVMPFWQAYTPAPHNKTIVSGGETITVPVGGGTFTGASIMPVIFRWNFLTHTQRIQPWLQAAGGVIYTTHKFPPDVLVPHGEPGGTSVWNFCPQGGVGMHYFARPGRSIDLGFNAIHISSASLGDRNPGVNAMWQLQIGYTFWK
jgi:lipid A 3-O-deacylase